MLILLNDLKSFSVHAEDGNIGRILDFYFDDLDWRIRYIVMDTKAWFTGKKVLIPPQVCGKPIYENSKFLIKMKKEEIKESPEISKEEPVSQQKKKAHVYHFKWPLYWENHGIGQLYSPISRYIKQDEKVKNGNIHLRSAKEVDRYCIKATDGIVGEVKDFIVDDKSWLIKYILVDIRRWLSGKNVKITPEKINWINWEQKTVSVNFKKNQLEKKPGYRNYYGYR